MVFALRYGYTRAYIYGLRVQRVNSFLSPLVDELLEFIDGVYMNVYSFSNPQLVKCALLCLACDMPVERQTAFSDTQLILVVTNVLKNFLNVLGEKTILGLIGLNGHVDQIASIAMMSK